MALYCSVRGCSNGTEESLDPTAKFFPFPSLTGASGGRMGELTRKRRLSWVSAVNRPNITFEHISPLAYVCSRHFHKGQPAYETLDFEPDWVPSLNMGHPVIQIGNPDQVIQRLNPDQVIQVIKKPNPDQMIQVIKKPNPDPVIQVIQRPKPDQVIQLIQKPKPDQVIQLIQKPKPDQGIQKPKPDQVIQLIKRPNPDYVIQLTPKPNPDQVINRPNPDPVMLVIQKPNPDQVIQKPNPDQVIQRPNPGLVIQKPKPDLVILKPKPDLVIQKPKPDVAIQRPIPDLVTPRPRSEIAAKSKQIGFLVQHKCCVESCDGRSHNNRGQRIRNGLLFFSFPLWRQRDGLFLSQLTKRRREAWAAVLGREDCDLEEAQVCSKHFISGKPAHDMMDKDPDWVPSLLLSRKTPLPPPAAPAPVMKRQSPAIKRPAPFGGKPMKKKLKKKVQNKISNPEKPQTVPWEALKSRLQDLMKNKEQAMDENQDNNKNHQSFEDFFRRSLSASLNACLESGSQSSVQPRPLMESGWWSTSQLSLSRFERPSSCSSAAARSKAPCEDCVRLQERIAQLEERLATPQFIQDPTRTQWSQPPPSAQPGLVSDGPIPETSPPPKGKFDPEMLLRHWFLRYSPKTNMMWCHVCRFFAAENNRRGGFVTGTRTFQNVNINQHSRTTFHRECVRKFMSRKARDLKL